MPASWPSRADRVTTFLNYGHPSPLVLRANSAVEYAEPPETAPPLGFASLNPQGPEPYQLTFAADDQVLFYTDGLIEARDPKGTFYPLDERAFLLKDTDPQTALETLRRDLVAHVNAPLRDDAAMLLLRFRQS